MKKTRLKHSIILFLIISIILALFATGYFIFKPCKHQWIEATCNSPKTCSICDEVIGTKLEHQWKDATCETAVTCTLCGEIAGNPVGHKWQDATCEEAKKCIVCDEVDGEPLGHTWKDATYAKPKTCSICGKTSGSSLTRPSNNSVNNNSSGNNNNTGTTAENYAKCLICSNRTSRSQTNYCSSHDCSQSYCPYPAKKAGGCWGSLCEFHACYYPNCLSIPFGGTNYCGAHRPED